MQIFSNDKRLAYSGRLDTNNPLEVGMIYPASFVRIKFVGKKISALIRNQHAYWDNYIGLVVDGKQTKILVSGDENQHEILLAEGLSDEEHDILLFKRQDSCHIIWFAGFIVDDNSVVIDIDTNGDLFRGQITGEVFYEKQLPRRIEIYGDSVSAGEVSEAVRYCGLEDPEHNGEYSNSYYSYSWFLARKLNASLHDIAQGGIALLDGTGYFYEPKQIGMLSAYNKISYNPEFGDSSSWDFGKFIPQIVIIAIGQNDNHPDDYMASLRRGDFKDDNSRINLIEKKEKWQKGYEEFVCKIRKEYENAHIILMTTILEHDKAWDEAIDEVCQKLRKEDKKIHHFLFSDNGRGTKGHIRAPEAGIMAYELEAFIKGLGEDVWEN